MRVITGHQYDIPNLFLNFPILNALLILLKKLLFTPLAKFAKMSFDTKTMSLQFSPFWCRVSQLPYLKANWLGHDCSLKGMARHFASFVALAKIL